MRYGPTTKGKAGTALQRLHELRCRADYDDILTTPHSSTAKLALELARGIVTATSKF